MRPAKSVSTDSPKAIRLSGNVRQERHKSCALDCLLDFSLMPCWHVGLSSRHHARMRRKKTLEVLRILIVYVLRQHLFCLNSHARKLEWYIFRINFLLRVLYLVRFVTLRLLCARRFSSRSTTTSTSRLLAKLNAVRHDFRTVLLLTVLVP